MNKMKYRNIILASAVGITLSLQMGSVLAAGVIERADNNVLLSKYINPAITTANKSDYPNWVDWKTTPPIIVNSDVYYASELYEAKKKADEVGGVVFAIRHGDNDWSTAVSIEESVLVNRLGYGIFIKK